MMVPIHWYLTLSAAVFMIGMFGFLTRRNIIIMFMSVELMLNAVNISLVTFSHYLQDLRGHILVFFIITVAAAEAAIGEVQRLLKDAFGFRGAGSRLRDSDRSPALLPEKSDRSQPFES
jgi:NADH-quinone oxidoreductase subunit K